MHPRKPITTLLAFLAGFTFLLSSVLTMASPGTYNQTTQQMDIDAVDVIEGGVVTETISMSLALINSAPLQLQIAATAATVKQGGNKAVWNKDTNTMVIPGATDGTAGFTFKLDLAEVVGSEPTVFNVVNAERLVEPRAFNRIATFPVHENSSIDMDAVAEIVDVTSDGMMLVYTDSEQNKIGFVDITNPGDPQPAGTVDLAGEPTSVAVAGEFALAGVNTSADFVNTSGELSVVNIATRTIEATLDLGGQPDAVAVSPDGRFAAVAIENERDEDLGDGAPPQAPSGFLVIVDIVGAPSAWTTRTVSFDGIPTLFPSDPEPEYVDINSSNHVVVSLQENNHMIIVDLATGGIVSDWSAGTVNLTQVDTMEEEPALISLTDTLLNVPREPDGIAWVGEDMIATANEGDLSGGSRGFSIFTAAGELVWDAGNSLDHATVRVGHYPDGRSGNKGNEPENIEYAEFEGNRYLFVNSERSSVVFVYNLDTLSFQILPSGGQGPEGIKAIPSRGLLVTASEEDNRGDKLRATLTIYQLQSGAPQYPSISSVNRIDGTPIPWSALSGLAADRQYAELMYTVPDSFYQKSRIYTMDVSGDASRIINETTLVDGQGLVTAIEADLVNSDNTVNLDLEGITVSAAGGFWLVSEGAGTVGDVDRPVTSVNLLLHVMPDGTIDSVVRLPTDTNNRQVRFGFEGVTATGAAGAEVLFVAFQREWAGDPAGQVRIGRYNQATSTWTFFYYPLDDAESPNGGWVGLSDITALSSTELAILERDNQAATDARIKRIYRVSTAGLTPEGEPTAGATPSFPLLEKTLVRDLVPDIQSTGGFVLEKIEGMAVSLDGYLYFNNDNDGIDDSNGESQMWKVLSPF